MLLPEVKHSLAKMHNSLLGFYALFRLCPLAPFHEHENVAAHAHACVQALVWLALIMPQNHYCVSQPANLETLRISCLRRQI